MWANYLSETVKTRAAKMSPGQTEMLDILAPRFGSFEARSTGNGMVAPAFELVEPSGLGLESADQIRVALHELNPAAKLEANTGRLD